MAESRCTALVTGAGRRVGAAIALDLARHGFDVAIHYHGSRQEAEAVAAEAQDAGARAVLFEADLCDVSDAARLVEAATAEFGAIRLLVNNASLFLDDELQDFDWDQFDRHLAIHLKSPIELARGFAMRLPETLEGMVVNLIDQRVWRPTPRFFSYSLSKAALWAATQTMAQALAPRIRVNAIGPGPTLRNQRQSEEDFSRQVDGLLLGRGPDLGEFGRTIRYLWEARSVTGQMIALDGGQHLAWQTPDVAGIAE